MSSMRIDGPTSVAKLVSFETYHLHSCFGQRAGLVGFPSAQIAFTRRLAFVVGQCAGDAANERSAASPDDEGESVAERKLFPIDLAIRRNEVAGRRGPEASKQGGYTGLALLRACQLLAVAGVEIAEVIESTANLYPPFLGAEQHLVAFMLRRTCERRKQFYFAPGELGELAHVSIMIRLANVSQTVLCSTWRSLDCTCEGEMPNCAAPRISWCVYVSRIRVPQDRGRGVRWCRVQGLSSLLSRCQQGRCSTPRSGTRLP
jgi:hypothetical protein